MNKDKPQDDRLYLPYLIQLQMSGCDLSVKYLEKLDETCVEFPHTHTSHEVYYILSGQLRMLLGDREQLLLPNQFILIQPGVHHGVVFNPDEPKEYVVAVYGIHRSGDNTSGRYLPGHDFIGRVEKALAGQLYIVAQDQNGCRELLPEIRREAHIKQPGWQLVLEDYCREFFIKLLRNVITAGPAADRVPLDTGQGNLAVEITKYMHEHYHDNITLEDISKAFHITPRHVTRIFSDYFGTSFRNTLSIYRLNYAKNYLCHTDKSAEEIASLVGISAVQTLYRLFKENEGITISEYRKTHRQKNSPPDS